MKKESFIIFIVAFSAILPLRLSAQPEFPFTGYENNPVLTPTNGAWDEACTFLASPFYYDGLYYLYYSGSEGSPVFTEVSLGYAFSIDGYNFVKENDPVFQADGTGFDSLGVGLSVVIEVDGDFRMYYNGIDQVPSPGPGKHIGLATAEDPGGPWSRLESPVLSSGYEGEWDAGCAEAQSVIKVDSGYMMFYYAVAQLPIEEGGSVGMAFSTDGTNWEKYDDPSTEDPPYAESDPVLVPGEPGTWDDVTILGCGVVKTWIGFEMFYTGIYSISADTVEYAIVYATSQDGIVWEKHPENPYKFYDDPYALLVGNYVLEEPKVMLNSDSSEYLLYYDYGFLHAVGEVGMASAPMLQSDILNPIKSGNGIMCNIYPNPAKDMFRLSLKINEPQVIDIEIINTSGTRIFWSGNNKVYGKMEKEIELINASPGVYFVRIISESAVLNKIVIMN